MTTLAMAAELTAKREFAAAIVKWAGAVLAQEKCEIGAPTMLSARAVLSVALELDRAEVPAQWHVLAESASKGRDKDQEVIAAGIGLQRAMECSRAGTFSTKRPKSGQAKSGDGSGTVIDPERLAVGRALFQLALVLDPTHSFRFSIAILSEKLADYALAIQQAGNVESGFKFTANELIKRCEQQMALGTQLQLVEPDGKTVEIEPLGLEDAKKLALIFATKLSNADFLGAGAHLSSKIKCDAEKLKRAYDKMTFGEKAFVIEVMDASDSMPGHKRADLGWVYVAIVGTNFSEAVAVVVTNETGVPRIRKLEWGRP